MLNSLSSLHHLKLVHTHCYLEVVAFLFSFNLSVHCSDPRRNILMSSPFFCLCLFKKGLLPENIRINKDMHASRNIEIVDNLFSMSNGIYHTRTWTTIIYDNVKATFIYNLNLTLNYEEKTALILF